METMKELLEKIEMEKAHLNIEIDVMIGFLNDIEDFYYLEREVASIERMLVNNRERALCCLERCQSLYEWIGRKKDDWCDEHD